MNIKFSLLKRKLMATGLILISLMTFSLTTRAALKITESVTGMPVSEETVKAGADLFKGKCAACHALNSKVVGPALSGVAKRRTHEWLLQWIRNNEKFRKTGDPDAIAIYEEYNGSAMSAFEDLTDDQINSIIMYTENGDLGAAPADSSATSAVAPPDKGLIKKVNWGLFIMILTVGLIVIMILKILDMVGKITGREVIHWNNVNANLMLLFVIAGLAACAWEYIYHGRLLLPESASEHGNTIDRMMSITLIITTFVFVVTQFLLFYFAFKYRKKKGVKALYYPDNGKLEMIWTVIPAIVLTILVIGGLTAWQKITRTPEKGTAEVEIFAYQFGWTARYPGADAKLGNANYNLISATNPLGVAVPDQATALIAELEDNIKDVEEAIRVLPRDLGKLKSTLGGLEGDERKSHLKKIVEIENGTAENELRKEIRRKNTQITRIKAAIEKKTFFTEAYADDIVSDEIHLPLNKEVTLRLRSRDVIHSAYLPYFRAQMNVVPGLPTQITFKPTLSTADMRTKLNNPEFDYYVVCNKICGNAHFNMKLKVVIESESEYKKWLASKQGTFVNVKNTEKPAEVPADSTTAKPTTSNNQIALK